MNARRHRAGATLALLLLAAWTAGCGNHRSLVAPVLSVASAPPEISVTAMRVGAGQTGMSRYRVSWQVTAGAADHFVYTLDPRPGNAPDSRWISTRATSFEFAVPVRSGALAPARDGRVPATTFRVRAVDGRGQLSPLGGISVVNDNIAPQVQITQPVPSDRNRSYVPSTVTIHWTGIDPDGGGSGLPAQYKWTLLTAFSPISFQTALADPDSVRRSYEPTGYAGWDSTGVDLANPAITYTHLVPGQDYMFVVVARDAAGAWNQIFTMNTNMLNMRVVADGQGGPILTMFNSLFFYQYPSASYLVDPAYQVPITILSGIPLTVNWIGVPVAGASLHAYRWALDIADVFDNTPRSNEATDLAHWSAPSANVTSATVGPFGAGETHVLYIEATDSNGLKSLGLVRATTVAHTSSHDLLIVDDTRLTVDQKPAGQACTTAPGGRWPTAAELDTFLYARGGVPWKCYPAGTNSTPGLFAGYDFDTIGTRGMASGTVPLSTLVQYRHVIWITDQTGATYTNSPTSPTNPITALRYMTAPGRENTLAAYLAGGGSLWAVGGGIAFASMINYDKLPNDTTQPAPGWTVSNLAGELIPGRFPYDFAAWRSEIKSTFTVAFINRSLGRFEGHGSSYDALPAAMHVRSALSDPYPPGRTVSQGNFYYTNFEIEYLSAPNDAADSGSPLDSLYAGTGASLVSTAFNPKDVCMTVWHRPGADPVIFTGFSLWSFQRAETKGLVDFVMRQLWSLGGTAPVAPFDGPPLEPYPIVRAPHP